MGSKEGTAAGSKERTVLRAFAFQTANIAHIANKADEYWGKRIRGSGVVSRNCEQSQTGVKVIGSPAPSQDVASLTRSRSACACAIACGIASHSTCRWSVYV